MAGKRGESIGKGMTPAAPFYVHWSSEKNKWGVLQGARARFASELCIQVTTLSQGQVLTGVGVVRTLTRGRIVVTA